MLDKVFDINNFNIYSDNDYYYFFRALNMADNKDFEDNIITDEHGMIQRIRTNLERYDGVPKYTKDSNISLEEMVNHIKMHQRKDTNCISLSTNANVSLVYGRGNYKDKYVIVKVPKEEMNSKVYNAGLYMLSEINKRIDSIIATEQLDDMQKYLIDFINNAQTPEKLEEIYRLFPKEYVPADDLFEGGLEFTITETRDFNALNKSQNFEKNKTVLKMDVLKKQIIPGMSNRFLIQTVGNAFSSLEFIHYKEINAGKLIDVSKQQMDVLGLLQQVPNNIPFIDEIKKNVIKSISDLDTANFSYNNLHLDSNDLSLEKIYEITQGRIDYKTAEYLYKTIFYLAKSKLRNDNNIVSLRKILGNNPKYNEFFNYIKDNTYGIEPEICTKLSNNLITISESVSLDINNNDRGLLDSINKLNENELLNILNNPSVKIKELLGSIEILDNPVLTMEEWMANSIIDVFDWKSFNVSEKLNPYQRQDIIKALLDNNFLDIYYELKNNKIDEKSIAKQLFLMLIKKNNPEKKNNSFTLEELESFIGYNTIKGLGLSLHGYQRSTLENIDRLLEEKDFASAILPTGTGKSYVALAEIYERVMNNPNEKILYLAPNVEIINQFKQLIRKVYKPEEHLGNSIDQVVTNMFKNIEFSTYQDLRDLSTKELKEKFGNDYDFIVFDELHRTGATEWQDIVETLLLNQEKHIKILGITATPERDMDMKNMADYWANQYGYTEEEILNNKHLAINLDIIEAIEENIICSPKVINCAYSLLNDGSLDSLSENIQNISDINKRNEAIQKYENLRRNVESASGVEKILHDNLKHDGKYIFFLPVTKNNGVYEDEDGNKVDKSTAERMIKDYELLIKQYMFGYQFFNSNSKILEINKKINRNENLDQIDKEYLNQYKEKLLLLSKIDIVGKPSSLNADTNTIADNIINYMNWDKITKCEQSRLLTKETEDTMETYSMLGSYANNKNANNLLEFNKPTDKKMKLMFVMNKLNEGVHPEGINGIVWLRPLDSNSKILFLQQLGRTIHASTPGVELDDDSRPLVIDLVNNTLKVKLDKETQEEICLRKLNNVINLMQTNNISDIENLDENLYSNLSLIYSIYNKYVENSNDIEKIEDVKTKVRIKQIIELGSTIDLWQHEFDIKKQEEYSAKQKTFDNLVDLFKISGIEKDFVDLYEETKLKSNNDNELVDRIHEVYVKYYNKESLPTNKSLDEFESGGQIYNWLSHKRVEIIEEAQNGNEEAKWIVNQKNWLTTLNDLIHEVYIKYYKEDGSGILPVLRSLDQFENGVKIGQWFSHNKNKIIEEAQNGNEEAKWIVNQKNWLTTLNDLIHEVYIKYYKEDGSGILPVLRSLDQFENGVKIGQWFSHNKNKIIEEAQNGNEEAKWIVNQKNWLTTLNDLIHEVYIKYYKEDGSGILPVYESLDEFENGVKIGYWLSTHKEEIIEEAQNGNEEAKWIASKKNWLATLSNLIHEAYTKYYKADGTGVLPSQASLDEFENGVKIGYWLYRNKNKIMEEAQNGNEEAKWIANFDKNLKRSIGINNLIHEVYIKYYKEDGSGILPIHASTDEFENGIKIGYWLSTHKEEIIEEAQNENEEAKWIASKKNWLATLNDLIHEAYTKYYREDGTGVLPSRSVVDEFENGIKIATWFSTHKEEIIEEAQNGNEEAKWIASKKNWLTNLNDLIHEVYTKYYKEDGSGTLPNKRSNDQFDTGSKIGTWITYNKEKIIDATQKENNEAKWIAEQKGWLTKVSEDSIIIEDNNFELKKLNDEKLLLENVKKISLEKEDFVVDNGNNRTR